MHASCAPTGSLVANALHIFHCPSLQMNNSALSVDVLPIILQNLDLKNDFASCCLVNRILSFHATPLLYEAICSYWRQEEQPAVRCTLVLFWALQLIVMHRLFRYGRTSRKNHLLHNTSRRLVGFSYMSFYYTGDHRRSPLRTPPFSVRRNRPRED